MNEKIIQIITAAPGTYVKFGYDEYMRVYAFALIESPDSDTNFVAPLVSSTTRQTLTPFYIVVPGKNYELVVL